MVLLHVKRRGQSRFLLEKPLSSKVGTVLTDVVALHNSVLKIIRICDEMEYLAEHGVSLPPEMRGLLESQIAELRLKDDDRYDPEGFVLKPDPVQSRTGKAPPPDLKEVLIRTVGEAKAKLNSVQSGVPLTKATVKECFDILKGAVSIVYPMGLPVFDPIQMEFENREDLSEKSNDVIDPVLACLWFASKQLDPNKTLADYMGKNEKTKVLVNVCDIGKGPPVRENPISEEEEKRLLAYQHKKMEELRRLVKDDDDSYLNSPWADPKSLRRKFQGIENVNWKPKPF